MPRLAPFVLCLALLSGCQVATSQRGDATLTAVQYGGKSALNALVIGKDWFLSLPPVPAGEARNYRYTIETAPARWMRLEILAVGASIRPEADGIPIDCAGFRDAATSVKVTVCDEWGNVLFEHGGTLEPAGVPKDARKWVCSGGDYQLFYYPNLWPLKYLRFDPAKKYIVDVAVTGSERELPQLQVRFHTPNNKG